jgi:hypothetical protein
METPGFVSGYAFRHTVRDTLSIAPSGAAAAQTNLPAIRTEDRPHALPDPHLAPVTLTKDRQPSQIR